VLSQDKNEKSPMSRTMLPIQLLLWTELAMESTVHQKITVGIQHYVRHNP